MFGERLEQARKLSGLSQEKLGELVGVTKMTISKYESDKLYPTSATLLHLGDVLSVGVDYFFRQNTVSFVGEPVFRKRQRLSKKQEQKILQQCMNNLEKQKEIQHILNIQPLQNESAEKSNAECYEDIDTLTQEIRKAWDLGLDPIENLMDVIESRGFGVCVVEAPKEFDALTVQTSDGINMIVLREDVPGDRQRFTLAHELGHYFLAEGEDIEARANYFAESFLVPRDMLLRDIGEQRKKFGINELYDLKMKYGASMMVILYRLYHLGIISESMLKGYQILFSKNGWKKTEPGTPYPPEKPVQMRRWVNRAESEGIISLSKGRELLGERITLQNTGEA